MANLFCVKDKVVIITGGAGILGRGIAGHLAEEGAKIVILDRAAEVGEQIVADIKAKGGEASFFLTDVLNKEILEQNKKDILAKYGRIDALLNAAGGNMAGATIGPDSTIFDLNIEAGDQSLAQLIGGIEHGILMSTNRSWSIDDARNKFQFGCEWGQLIENGELKGVVKNPNYRAISAQFWKSLSAVGNILIFCVGTNLFGLPHVRVANLLPALVIAVIWVL